MSSGVDEKLTRTGEKQHTKHGPVVVVTERVVSSARTLRVNFYVEKFIFCNGIILNDSSVRSGCRMLRGRALLGISEDTRTHESSSLS